MPEAVMVPPLVSIRVKVVSVKLVVKSAIDEMPE